MKSIWACALSLAMIGQAVAETAADLWARETPEEQARSLKLSQAYQAEKKAQDEHIAQELKQYVPVGDGWHDGSRFMLFRTRDKQSCLEAGPLWHDALSSWIPRPVCWRRDGDRVMFCDIRPKNNDFGWRLDPENCTGWIDGSAFGLKPAKKTVPTDSPRAH